MTPKIENLLSWLAASVVVIGGFMLAVTCVLALSFGVLWGFKQLLVVSEPFIGVVPLWITHLINYGFMGIGGVLLIWLVKTQFTDKAIHHDN